MAFLTGTAPRSHHRPARRFGLGALFSVWRQRRALANLDEAALRDIGVTRAEAQAEASRPVWDVPETWRY